MVSLKIMILTFLRTRPIPKGKIEIGEFTTGTPIIESYNRENMIKIGRFSMLASDVMLIVGAGNKPSIGSPNSRVTNFWLSILDGKKAKPEKPSKAGFILIGNDVWIGAKAIILSNVTVGDGAIVGAGAIVTHDIPPYAVVAGVPAKIIRFRFSKSQIEKLLKISWWNWSNDAIKGNVDYLRGDPDLFIQRFS
jgi:virginiamycin A acetyltransferase